MRVGRLLLSGLLFVAGAALGQSDEHMTQLRLPQRLTTGVADQLLGQLSPDGKSLVFITNRNTTNELYRQNVADGKAKLLFDESADVTWPRISPDGKKLLYISFRDHADGQLCVRSFPSGDDRRCLEDASSAVQAEWRDAHRAVLVSNASIQGNLKISEVDVDRRLFARPLFDRNMTSPAVSPDGRWLVFVPVERRAQLVGPAFASRAMDRLGALRLDRPSEPSYFQLDLPGATGQPVFARDGHSLYFVQFFSDTNQDGVLDAQDHGVLFRVPFEAARDNAPELAAEAMPEQLTDSSWNCQYPAPSTQELLATCAGAQALDIYELPLDGEVPSSWTAERVERELGVAALPVEELLLYRHLLARKTDVSARRLLMMKLIRLHLEQDEFRAAEYYVKHLHALKDPATAGLNTALTTYIHHREAIRDRERGRLVDDFDQGERKRLAELNPAKAKSVPAVLLDHVVRSELADGIGDISLALAEFKAATVQLDTPPSILEAYYEQADALYRELDDREALVEVGRRLSAQPSINPEQQLRYARDATKNMIRGLPFAEAEKLLDKAREHAPPGTELAFALQLQRAVLEIRSAKDGPEVAQRLADLYRAQTLHHRRRAIMLEAVRRSSAFGAHAVTEALAEAYLRDAERGTQEQVRAQQLYRRTITNRAYGYLAQGKKQEALADFDTLARKTASAEAALAAAGLRLQLGEKPEAVIAQYTRNPAVYSGPTLHLVHAYVLTRTLPKLDDAQHAKTAEAAIAQLMADWSTLRSKRSTHVLLGAIQHEKYLRTGDSALAEKASTQYLIALGQVGTNLRVKAMLLNQLGLLHTQVGNYRLALKYLEEREKLPYGDNMIGLAVKLALARSLLHVGREADAAHATDAALAMIDASPRLEPYRPLVLDRAALYHLAINHFEKAVKLYDREFPLLEKRDGSRPSKNRFVARLAHAAAELGAGRPQVTLEDLKEVEQELKAPAVEAILSWPHTRHDEVLRSYGLIIAGLKANANRRLGQLEAVGEALERRHALLVEKNKGGNPDEQLKATTLAEARLADNQLEQGKPTEAVKWLTLALQHGDAFAAKSHTPASAEQLDVLLYAAQLQTLDHAQMDVRPRVRKMQQQLQTDDDASWRPYERWFEILMALDGEPPAR